MEKALRFQDPGRAPSLAALGDRLHAWEQLGLEVVAAGQPVPEWVQRGALMKLVPQGIADEMAGRPDLSSYRAALAFIKLRLAHHKAQLLPGIEPVPQSRKA